LILSEDEKQVVSAAGGSSVVSHKRKRLRKPDTNVLSVKFNRLLQPGNLLYNNNNNTNQILIKLIR
jgi:hypothetical protein